MRVGTASKPLRLTNVLIREKGIDTRMARTISIADSTKTKVTRKPPLLIMIAGATGVGKSTTAVSIAGEHAIVRFVSTDAIRETMRVADTDENAALHRSSFSKGESGDPVLDWQDTCKAVESGVLAAIERAQREGVDLIIEGVHIEPSSRIIREWKNSGGIAIGIVMHIEEEEKHISFFKQREVYTFRNAERYISSLPRIRAIQGALKDRAKIVDWYTIDPSTEKDVLAKVRHWIDLEWNEWNKSH